MAELTVRLQLRTVLVLVKLYIADAVAVPDVAVKLSGGFCFISYAKFFWSASAISDLKLLCTEEKCMVPGIPAVCVRLAVSWTAPVALTWATLVPWSRSVQTRNEAARARDRTTTQWLVNMGFSGIWKRLALRLTCETRSRSKNARITKNIRAEARRYGCESELARRLCMVSLRQVSCRHQGRNVATGFFPYVDRCVTPSGASDCSRGSHGEPHVAASRSCRLRSERRILGRRFQRQRRQNTRLPFMKQAADPLADAIGSAAQRAEPQEINSGS